MAIVNGYATLAQIKAYLSTASTNDDSRLELAIEAASRAIDNFTRRVFFSTSAIRFFEAEEPDYLSLPDDLLSVTEIAVDTGDRQYVAFGPNDFELEPGTAPYSSVYTSHLATLNFPHGRRGVRINGSWGYNATGSHPQAINQACLILAVRFFKRRDAAFGVIGTPELGFSRVSSKDPEVNSLLTQYRKIAVYGC